MGLSEPSPDVLIAGGGIAGATLAILLGRRGFAVELLEQRRFPSEKPCGEGLMPAAVGVLERLGLLAAVGGAPFLGIRYHAGELVAEGRFAHGARAMVGLAQRRLRLDQILFEAARATAGVRARTGVRVEAPLLEGGRVIGLRTESGIRRAALVVAADGAGSRLRRALGLDAAPSRRARAGVRAHFLLAPGHAQPPWVEVFLAGRHELYVTPLPEGQVLVAALYAMGAAGGDIQGAFHAWIEATPVLRERLAGATQLTRVEGRAPLSGRARAGVVPGAVLLGDAAGWTDPVTGGGIAQALLAAELLAESMPRPLGADEGWLGAFERRRARLLRGQRVLTGLVLELVERPWLARAALRVFRAFPPLFSRLAGMAGGVALRDRPCSRGAPG